MQITLRVLNGSSEGKEITVKKEKFLIGRHEDCHLRPKTDSVSRRHCMIQINGEQALCRDMGSKNGTFVNDQKLTETIELHSGDLLRVGKMRFEVAITSTSDSPAKTDDSSRVVVDGDVSDWLEEADLMASQQRIGDPETRQFRLSDLENVKAKSEIETTTGEPTNDQTETKSDSKRLARRTPQTSDNSRDAAADVLKRYFNRT